jgi:hypothetical protein
MWEKQTTKDARTNSYRQPYLRRLQRGGTEDDGPRAPTPPSARQYETRGGCPIGRRTCGKEISQRREKSDTKERRCDDGEYGKERGTEGEKVDVPTRQGACCRVAGPRDTPAVYSRCRHVQSRLGTWVIRFGRRGEGKHRESRMLGRSTAMSSVEQPPSVKDEG